MNVCMIAYSVYEFDNRVLRYAETLQKEGHTVDVIALAMTNSLATETINGVNVFRIQRRTWREKAPISYLLLILLFCWRTMLCLIRRQGQIRYDLVHVHSVPDFLVFTAWLPKLRGAKIILDIHDLLPELYASKFGCSERSTLFRLLRVVERISTEFADHVIIANHIWGKKLVSRAVPVDKCTAIINYPDRSIFERRGRTRDDGKFVLVYPGSLNWHQGLDLAIRAFDRVKETVPNAEFHIYGGGTALGLLHSLVEDLGLQGRVLLQGTRPLREIAEILENADLGVVPKRNDPFGDEAFSTKIMEFMSMGIPVVISETTIDRYYFDSSLVRFFKPGDEASLADALQVMMTDDQLRARLARNASRFIENNDWETHKHIYLEIVSALVPEREGRARGPAGEETITTQDGGRLLEEYYRCDSRQLRVAVQKSLSVDPRFFRFGPELTCFGRYTNHRLTTSGTPPDVLDDITLDEDGTTLVPFDPYEVASNLRYERYSTDSPRGHSIVDKMVVSAYYWLRPMLSMGIRKQLQKVRLDGWRKLEFPHWPVDHTVDGLCQKLLLLCLRNQGLERIPFIWFWPDGAPSCAMMTHDVETAIGRDECGRVMDLDDKYGIKASFQIVPEDRYEVPKSYIDEIWKRGFEVTVQDLNHDGRLFWEHQQFAERAIKINRYVREYNASGFRSAVLYRNQDWYDALDVEYDMSVPSVAHLDPQRGGCCTVMPYFVGHMVELPLTMTQDYSLFNILQDYSLGLWNQQMALVMEKHGLINYIIHPDYVTRKPERDLFEALLERLSELHREKNVWIALPSDVSRWWKQRNAMKIVVDGDSLRIEGEGSERAVIGLAKEKDGCLVLEAKQDRAIACSQR